MTNPFSFSVVQGLILLFSPSLHLHQLSKTFPIAHSLAAAPIHKLVHVGHGCAKVELTSRTAWTTLGLALDGGRLPRNEAQILGDAVDGCHPRLYAPGKPSLFWFMRIEQLRAEPKFTYCEQLDLSV